MDLVYVGAAWLHAVAMVIVIGYYGILARVVLPALSRSVDGAQLGGIIAAIERRALPLVALSIGLFTATGLYLLAVDPKYAGIGNVFASTWTTLMLVKHAVVVLMVVVGGVVHYLATEMSYYSEPDRAVAFRRLSLAAEAVTGLGALVLLLTAAAQAS